MLLFIYLFFFLPSLQHESASSQIARSWNSRSCELFPSGGAFISCWKGLTGSSEGGETSPAKWDNRLHFGTFLRTLQPALHHSTTFLISASKCSLDTLIKRGARQTCTTCCAQKVMDEHFNGVSFPHVEIYMFWILTWAAVYLFPHLSGDSAALCTAELSTYETVSNTNTPVSSYWRTTVSYLFVSLHCGSITHPRRSTRCDRSHHGHDTEFLSCRQLITELCSIKSSLCLLVCS